MAITMRSYKSGSIVYMEGDKSEYIYILKSGRVVLTTKKVEDKTWVEEKVHVKPGEFFGVKSALGRYPRDETAQTLGDTVVLVLTLADFEKMILQNVGVVKKMLRVFSNQLRKIGKTVREVLGEGESINPEVELFKLGEYYYNMGRPQQAMYAFKKYLEYYPDSKYASQAKDKLQQLKSGNFATSSPGVGFSTQTRSGQRIADENMTDFNIEEEDISEQSKPETTRSPLGGEMDDFLSDNKSNDILDDLTLDDQTFSEVSMQDINEIFYEGMRLFASGQYQDAVKLYERIINSKSLQGEAEKRIYEKAHFELGRCHYKLGKYNEALNTLSGLIKKFPKSTVIKNALLYMGMIFEDLKNYEKAIAYYSKAASMEPKDQTNRDAQNRLMKIQNSQGRR
ncbi:MAG: tetratricopeptide repeat protein [Spirochaetes bacterium]|nr:tetratricopeptide repeat protein [Spirochaetota bacterium]